MKFRIGQKVKMIPIPKEKYNNAFLTEYNEYLEHNIGYFGNKGKIVFISPYESESHPIKIQPDNLKLKERLFEIEEIKVINFKQKIKFVKELL